MTVIMVHAPTGRLTLDQRRELARTLTDAVLVPEIGQLVPQARVGFQVHFVERDVDRIAIAGSLLSDSPQDVILVDVCVMAAAWPDQVRAEVIRNVYEALTAATAQDAPQPGWWVQFRVIDEGSWGSRGDVLSILGLLATGVFTPEREKAVREALGG